MNCQHSSEETNFFSFCSLNLLYSTVRRNWSLTDGLLWPFPFLQQKEEKIGAILNQLPDEILDKLPLPPEFDHLPDDAKKKIREIGRDRQLTMAQKHQKISSIIDALPPNIRRLIPPPVPPPVFDHLPAEVRDQLKAVFKDESLNWEERHRKIHAIMKSLPEEVVRALPRPPPPPPRPSM